MQSSMALCVLRQWNGVQLALEVDLMVLSSLQSDAQPAL